MAHRSPLVDKLLQLVLGDGCEQGAKSADGHRFFFFTGLNKVASNVNKLDGICRKYGLMSIKNESK